MHVCVIEHLGKRFKVFGTPVIGTSVDEFHRTYAVTPKSEHILTTHCIMLVAQLIWHLISPPWRWTYPVSLLKTLTCWRCSAQTLPGMSLDPP